MTFFAPVRPVSSTALTPRSDGRPEAQTRPFVGGMSPAMARSSVLLPDPLRPMMPTASPWLTTNETSLTACTLRTELTGLRFVSSRSTKGSSPPVSVPFCLAPKTV